MYALLMCKFIRDINKHSHAGQVIPISDIHIKKNNIHNREHASFNKRVFIWMTEGDQAM